LYTKRSCTRKPYVHNVRTYIVFNIGTYTYKARSHTLVPGGPFLVEYRSVNVISSDDDVIIIFYSGIFPLLFLYQPRVSVYPLKSVLSISASRLIKYMRVADGFISPVLFIRASSGRRKGI
jgi:hypothetical protein